MKNKFIFLSFFIIIFVVILLFFISAFYVIKLLFFVQNNIAFSDINWNIPLNMVIRFVKISIFAAVGVVVIAWIYYKYDV